MELSNDFEVSAPIEKVWEVINDVELIAPCLPVWLFVDLFFGDTRARSMKGIQR